MYAHELANIKTLLLSGDAASYELAQQLAIGLDIDIQPILNAIRACTEDYNKWHLDTNTPVEVIQALRRGAFYLYNVRWELKDYWTVFEPIIHSFEAIQHSYTAIPNVILQWHNLRKLVLRDGNLQTIDAALWQLPYLEAVDLLGNSFTAIDNNIQFATQLRTLKLKNKALIQLPVELATLPNLHNLYYVIDNYALDEELPLELFMCKQLQRLTIGGLAIRNIPRAITKLYNLHTLSIEFMNIRQLPYFLAELPRLRCLVLNSLDKLSNVLPVLAMLQDLEELELWAIGIDEFLTDDVICLQFLRKLSIYSPSTPYVGNVRHYPHFEQERAFLQERLPHTVIYIE